MLLVFYHITTVVSGKNMKGFHWYKFSPVKFNAMVFTISVQNKLKRQAVCLVNTINGQILE